MIFTYNSVKIDFCHFYWRKNRYLILFLICGEIFSKCQRRPEGRGVISVELFLLDHLDDLDALSRRRDRTAHTEALHRLGDLLDKAIILFDSANGFSGRSADDQPGIFNGKRYSAHENAKCHFCIQVLVSSFSSMLTFFLISTPYQCDCHRSLFSVRGQL